MQLMSIWNMNYDLKHKNISNAYKIILNELLS